MLSFVFKLLYGPIDLYMHAGDNFDRAFAIFVALLLYITVLSALFFIAGVIFYITDTLGVIVQKQPATIKNLTFKQSYTTWTPTKAGQTLIIIPQFYPACWQTDIKVEDQTWSTSISENEGNELTVGQAVVVDYQKGRISGFAHILSVKST